MTFRHLRFGALLAMSFAVATSGGNAPRAHADGPADVTEAQRAIAELRIEDARDLIEPLLRTMPEDPAANALGGVVDFHRGRYGRAVERLERAQQIDTAAALLATVRSTRDLMSSYVRHASDDGRYEVWVAPDTTGGPSDATLVPYALETLRTADEAIGGRLGYRHPGPIRLEIYPDAASLAQVSSLTEEDIARSGTIALCKWDRLMVTSPRALLRGYPWADTIAHEFVHLTLARASLDRAPVWVQEGVAKYLEQTYRRGEPTGELDAPSQALLSDAASHGRLLPFERLHPSIALLPSQRDAALAFAQVATFVGLFHRAQGDEGLRALVVALAQGDDAQDAFAAIAGAPFAELERGWQEHARGLPAPPTARTLPRRLVVPGMSVTEREARERAEVAEDARRSLRLGDLLYGRRRYRAASVEYGDALEIAPHDPVVVSRYARSALAGGDANGALAALQSLVELTPDYAPAHSLLAEAARAADDPATASRAALAALRLNPFDPTPHCVLAEVGPEAHREREGAACRALRR